MSLWTSSERWEYRKIVGGKNAHGIWSRDIQKREQRVMAH